MSTTADSVIIVAPRAMGKNAFMLSTYFKTITGLLPRQTQFLDAVAVYEGVPPDVPFRLHLSIGQQGRSPLTSVRVDRVKMLVVLGADYASYQRFIEAKRIEDAADTHVTPCSQEELYNIYDQGITMLTALGLVPTYCLGEFCTMKEDRVYRIVTEDEFGHTVIGNSVSAALSSTHPEGG